MNAEQLAFLADAAKSLDEVRERNDETKSFLYLGRVEVKCEGELVGYLEDPDALGYSYESVDPNEASEVFIQGHDIEHLGEDRYRHASNCVRCHKFGVAR